MQSWEYRDKIDCIPIHLFMQSLSGTFPHEGGEAKKNGQHETMLTVYNIKRAKRKDTIIYFSAVSDLPIRPTVSIMRIISAR